MESTETNTTSTPSRTNATTQEGKTVAIIAYITLIGLVIAFIMNNEKKNSFASYHIKQSLGLALTGIALGIVGMIPFLGWIVNFLGVFILLYMWIMGLVNAINEKEKPVPILGEKYKEWLKSIK
ncbi:hypothetical protein V8G61_07640 [Gaetbulibacter sp. M240]|uniref:DUF4870 domain-containing protein n=1 Tax=Gaetbulibacter sp. M240 TaxID=3126511 RepID=UPI00374F258B